MLLLHFRLNCATSYLPDQSGALIRITRLTRKWCARFPSRHLSPVRSAPYFINNRLSSSLEVLVLNPPPTLSWITWNTTLICLALLEILWAYHNREILHLKSTIALTQLKPARAQDTIKTELSLKKVCKQVTFLITALEYQQQIKQLFDTMNESQAKEKIKYSVYKHNIAVITSTV